MVRRHKVYRGIIFATRVIRWLMWGGLGVYAGMALDRLHFLVRLSGGVGTGTGMFTTAELVALFIVVFAADRVQDLIAQDLRDRLPVSIEQAT